MTSELERVPSSAWRALLALMLLVALAAAVAPARAAGIVVNSAADNTIAGDGDCTLREAIANAESDFDFTGGDCAAVHENITSCIVADFDIVVEVIAEDREHACREGGGDCGQ